MLVPALAFLNVGPLEFALLGVLFLLLLGPQSVPRIAREVGRVQARLASVRREFEEEARRIELEEDYRATRGVPKEPSPAMSDAPEDERARLESAARALGLDPAPLTDEELKAAIRRRTE
ncbi:MAG: hypothetical protein ACT4PT_11065 [Methanobacteriota archaeon]